METLTVVPGFLALVVVLTFLVFICFENYTERNFYTAYRIRSTMGKHYRMIPGYIFLTIGVLMATGILAIIERPSASETQIQNRHIHLQQIEQG